jgi:hypothetical protein
VARLASYLICSTITLFYLSGCSVENFESKETLMEAITLLLINKANARVIDCPSMYDLKVDGKKAVKKCFAQSTELNDFISIIDSEVMQYSTRDYGWQTDYGQTDGGFTTKDRKYAFGFGYVPRPFSNWPDYAPLKNDTVFLSVIVEDNKIK